ncbi:outer-membrane lipoprotein carrier protein LolA [Pelagibacteraceae bacterium]|nr:outer-membrane lipoprotein carrier protein LolA [Pelagibacteraceae bacterium]
MFSKNEKYLSYFYIIVFLILSFKVDSNTDIKIKILDYLNSLQYFSASFIQNDNENLSEGKVYIGKKRVRADYLSPSKILIILDEDKAMYYNYELEEDEFFNPKNTNAWFFYDVFRNPYFFEDSEIILKNKEIILKKSGFDNEENKYLINAYFENSPVILRKIEVFINDAFLQISIFDHNYNEDFDKNFFKLISPKLLN